MAPSPVYTSEEFPPEHTKASSLNVYVVIPALNEETSVVDVISRVKQEIAFATIVVVDDCSDDETVARARAAGAFVLPLAHHLGAWSATQTGIRFAVKRGADLIVTMDADGQHSASDLPLLMEPVIRGSSDVVIGNCVQRGSTLRKVAWWILRQSSGISLGDLTSGFRVYNRRSSELLAEWQASLLAYQDIGVLTLLLSHNIHIVDVDTTMQDRQSGHSRLFHTWSKVGYYMAYSLILGISKRKLRQFKAHDTRAVA
jgi:glycosyltransferase involved in cell wall biosynthesis